MTGRGVGEGEDGVMVELYSFFVVVQTLRPSFVLLLSRLSVFVVGVVVVVTRGQSFHFSVPRCPGSVAIIG